MAWRQWVGAISMMWGVCTGVLAQPVAIRIIAFNDFHGNLQSPGTIRSSAAVPAPGVAAGGVDMLAGYVKTLKTQHPNSVVVSAGDLIGASPLVSALFHDEGTIEAMNRLGLEFNAVGNHEFDEGSAELLRLQNGGCNSEDLQHTCKGALVGTATPFEGAHFQFLAANVQDSSGHTLFPAYGIKTFDGLRIGFIGVTLHDAPTIVTPSGVAGLTFKDEVATINALVPQLQAQGVAAIVVLIHQGGAQTIPPAPVDINACAGNLEHTPIRDIVGRLVDGVDVVISGHTHAAYICKLPNSVGRPIAVTSANSYGRVLTTIDLEIAANARAVVAAARNQVVDRTDTAVTADAGIAQLINNYSALVAPIANRIIGSITTALPSEGDRTCEAFAGELIADAQLQATQPTAMGGAQIALMNSDGVRAPGFTFPQSAAGEGDGNITYGEAASVQPFGNSLVTMSLTGAQLNAVLEQQFEGCLGQTVTRILQVSKGLKFSYDFTLPACHKIVKATFNGKALAPKASYRVTVNSFMADGGDGFTELTHGIDRLGGPQDIDALAKYLAAYDVSRGHNPYDPAAKSLDKPRIQRLDTGLTCP